MLQQLWDTFVILIPVFFLLTMIFGAGFYIGRVSKESVVTSNGTSILVTSLSLLPG